MKLTKKKISSTILSIAGVILGIALFLTINSNPIRDKQKSEKIIHHPMSDSGNRDVRKSASKKLSLKNTGLKKNAKKDRKAAALSTEDSLVQYEDEELEIHQQLHEERVKKLAEINRYANTVDELVESEPVDPSWADSATETLITSIEKIDSDKIELVDLECRSRLCRANFVFDPSSLDESLDQIPQLIPWKTETFSFFEDNDLGDAVVYITREGHRLPRM